MKIKFLPIRGYEDQYLISNVGDIFYKKGKHLKSLWKNKKGYKKVTLSKGGKERNFFVHRIVLETFVGPSPGPEYCTDHIDGDKTNNCYRNLEWVTRQENGRRNKFNGCSNKGIRNGSSTKLTEAQVFEIRKLETKIPIKEISHMYGVHYSTIWYILKRESWKHL